MQTELRAVIKGTTLDGKPFEDDCQIELIKPEGSFHYGTGYYMTVEKHGQKELYDVRYEKTKEIRELTKRWIKNYYGSNAEEVTFHSKIVLK